MALGRRRARDGSRHRRWPYVVVVVAVIGLLLPVPWMHVISADPPGTAWRLDGRLTVNEGVIDPPGQWTWLAVGRPPLVIEVIHDRIAGTGAPMQDLRQGKLAHRPALSDPAAATVGLQHAGRDLQMRLAVEVRDPMIEGLPPIARLASVNGVELTDRAAWNAAIAPKVDHSDVADPAESFSFTTGTGQQFSVDGSGLPYRVVSTLDLAPEGLDARIRFAALERLPTDWFRNLSLGSSHGMMVALTTYAEASGTDLAQGRHIAGTGGILGDGTVTRIGQLPAKAKAANRAGADVLIVPAGQLEQLEDVELHGTTVIGVTTLQEAIDALAVPVA